MVHIWGASWQRDCSPLQEPMVLEKSHVSHTSGPTSLRACMTPYCTTMREREAGEGIYKAYAYVYKAGPPGSAQCEALVCGKPVFPLFSLTLATASSQAAHSHCATQRLLAAVNRVKQRRSTPALSCPCYPQPLTLCPISWNHVGAQFQQSPQIHMSP